MFNKMFAIWSGKRKKDADNIRKQTVLDCKYQAAGMRFLVSDNRYQLATNRLQLIRFLVTGYRYQFPSIKRQVAGFKYQTAVDQISSIRLHVSGLVRKQSSLNLNVIWIKEALIRKKK